jgi:hypothetical protein
MLCFALALAGAPAGADEPQRPWSRLWGSTGKHDRSGGVVIAATDAVYVAGLARGSMDGQSAPGSNDFFLSRLRPDGLRLWTRVWGSPQNELSLSSAQNIIAAGSGDVLYVVGDTDGAFAGQTNSGQRDACLMAYSADGSQRWARIWGSAGDDGATCVAADDAGFVYVAGFTDGTLGGADASDAEYNAFLSKFDAAGALLWSYAWDTGAYVFATDLALDRSGRVLAVGYTDANLDGQTNPGMLSFCLRVTTPDGSALWTRVWGSTQSDYAYGVAVDASTAIYVAGQTDGVVDGQPNGGYTWHPNLCVSKFDSAGTRLWSYTWGDPIESDSCHDLAVSPAGEAMVGGITLGKFDGQPHVGYYGNAFITQLTAGGSTAWSRIWGATNGATRVFGLALDARENLFCAGECSGNLDGQTNTAVGAHDAMLGLWLRTSGLSITTTPFTVELPLDTADMAGTHDADIPSGSVLTWRNATATAITGAFNATASGAWIVTNIPLLSGINVLEIAGSNTWYNAGVSDSITVELVPEPALLAGLFVTALVGRRYSHHARFCTSP